MTSNQISYYKAKEEERHNKAMEQETARANRRNEAIAQMKADTEKAHYERSDSETQRSHLVSESQNAVTLDQGYTKLAQENAKIAETKRSNRANEEIAWINANAKAQEAASKTLTSRASAEADYARAGLLYAQTAATDVEAALNAARTDLTQAQRDQVIVSIPNTMADTQVKRATRDKIITETAYIPITTWSNVVGNVLRGGATILGGI